MLVLDISNKKKSKTKNRAHRFAAVLLQLHLKLGVIVHSLNFCIIFRFFSKTWPNITNTSKSWVMQKRYLDGLSFQHKFGFLAQFSQQLCSAKVKLSDQSFDKKLISLIFFIFRCIHASLYQGLSVLRSVRQSVGPSAGPSVHNAFFQTADFEWKWHINHRISIEFEQTKPLLELLFATKKKVLINKIV